VIARHDQVRALATLLKPLGFKKRGATWHRGTPDAIWTINVQGSQWGGEYYLNVGTYLRALGDEVAPPEFRCHVRARIHPPERPASLLVEECRRWFEQFGAIDALVTHFRNNSLPPATTGAAMEWLREKAA
jgi:hypothetical protein